MFTTSGQKEFIKQDYFEKPKTIKERNDAFDYIHGKNFCSSKETIKAKTRHESVDDIFATCL